MSLPLNLRAEILKTLMLEDRQEIRSIRLAIYQLIALVTLSSFGLTAFLLNSQLKNQLVFAFIDAMLLLIIWVGFLRLKVDLYHARQCQKLRERLIVELDSPEGETSAFQPCQSAANEIPSITDADLKWVPILSTFVILSKIVLLATILPYITAA